MNKLPHQKIRIKYLISMICLIAVAICLIESPDTRAQGTQTGGQKQSGLTPEKKRSLSNFGPEDVFPGESGDRTQDQPAPRRPTAPARRSARQLPTPSPAATLTPQPVLSTSPQTGLTAPMPGDAAQIGAVRTPSNKLQPPPEWLLPSLAAVTLIVLTAFIYTIYKLYEKLRANGR